MQNTMKFYIPAIHIHPPEEDGLIVDRISMKLKRSRNLFYSEDFVDSSIEPVHSHNRNHSPSKFYQERKTIDKIVDNTPEHEPLEHCDTFGKYEVKTDTLLTEGLPFFTLSSSQSPSQFMCSVSPKCLCNKCTVSMNIQHKLSLHTETVNHLFDVKTSCLVPIKESCMLHKLHVQTKVGYKRKAVNSRDMMCTTEEAQNANNMIDDLSALKKLRIS